jgi:acyl carrier protein
MNQEQLEALVRECLREVAPESQFDSVPVDADYRDVLSLDSLDFLQLVELLSERSGVRIDESDYPRLSTIGSTVDFLVHSTPQPAPAGPHRP